ncbi:MAG: DUF4230 domain-containing protein [Desulfobacterota bacterium]|jgi:hypothetical protein|nr:DUF4230 domain-containing protein [Thermodesulfobacteriota bacterium]
MKTLKTTLIMVIALCIGGAGTYVALPFLKSLRAVFEWDRVEKQTLTLLQSEAMAFLVTDRIASQIVVSVSESNILLGQREGYLIGTARLYYGIDMKELTANSISLREKQIVVTLPPAKELDFAVDLESLHFISKMSGTVALVDWLKGKDMYAELRAQFKPKAIAFMKQNSMIPDRQRLLARLNSMSSVLTENLGLKVNFE